MSPLPSSLLALLALAAASLPDLSAQSTPDAPDRQKAGIALVKPQAWSKDDQSTVLEFLSVSNHTGYYQFKTAKQPSFQVPSAKVVTLIYFPESQPEITSAAQRAALQKTIDEFAAASQKFPPAARQLEQAVAPLKEDAAKFDAGSVKTGGVWILKTEYYRQKASALAELIKPEILSAPKIKSYDLAGNQYFLSLQDLAASEPSVKPVIAGLQALYDSLVRKDDRNEILRQLNSNTLTYEQALDLVNKLKTLKPQEDATANLYIQSWDAASGKAAQLTALIGSTQEQFEAAMAGLAESQEVPVPDSALQDAVKALSDAVRQYRAGTPPPVIHVPLPVADAVISFCDNLPVLAQQVKARELLDAKSILDTLVRQAALIGPKSTAALAGVQKKVNGDVEKFLALRNEAKLLADSGKPDEALKKYQQAYALIPAKDVAASIDGLKKK